MENEAPLFGGPKETACPTCQQVRPDAKAARKCEAAHKTETPCPTCKEIRATPEEARECKETHERDARRDKARAFARGGPSQFRKVKP